MSAWYDALYNTIIIWHHHTNVLPIYTSELCQWLSDNTGRLSYIDDAQEEGLIAAEADTFKRLQIGQFECIRSMAVRIIGCPD